MEKKKWIQDAIKHKGALRKEAKREHLIKGDEKLSMADLHKLEKKGGKTAKRAYLAETLRGFGDGGDIESKRERVIDYLINNEDDDDLYEDFGINERALENRNKYYKEIYNKISSQLTDDDIEYKFYDMMLDEEVDEQYEFEEEYMAKGGTIQYVGESKWNDGINENVNFKYTWDAGNGRKHTTAYTIAIIKEGNKFVVKNKQRIPSQMLNGKEFNTIEEAKKALLDYYKLDKSSGMGSDPDYGRYAKGGITAQDMLESRQYLGELDWRKLKRKDKLNSTKYLKRTGKIGYKKGGKLEPEESQEYYASMQYENGGMEDDTFVMLFKGYGFVEKRGSYGTRTFYNKEHNAYIYYDPKYRNISGFVGGGEGNDEVIPYSVEAVLDFFIEHDITESEPTPMAKGGDLGKVFELKLKNPNGGMTKRVLLSANTKEDASKKALDLKDYKGYGYIVESVNEFKMAKGGKVKRAFLETMAHLHQEIDEIKLKDGTKITHEELAKANNVMAEGGMTKGGFVTLYDENDKDKGYIIKKDDEYWVGTHWSWNKYNTEKYKTKKSAEENLKTIKYLTINRQDMFENFDDGLTKKDVLEFINITKNINKKYWIKDSIGYSKYLYKGQLRNNDSVEGIFTATKIGVDRLNDSYKYKIQVDELYPKELRDIPNLDANQNLKEKPISIANKDWKKYVKDNSSFSVDEETENKIVLATRENGSVGDEQHSPKDIERAKNILKNIKDKYPNTKGRIYTVDEWVMLELEAPKEMAKGGMTFEGKVERIAKKLEGKPVPKPYRKEYGSKYDKDDAREAAERIVGNMTRMERKK